MAEIQEQGGADTQDAPERVPERRTGSLERLAALVASRNETLVRYSILAGIRPYETHPETAEALRRFCQALVDYAATAHFQLYRYLADGRERRQAVLAVAREVYPLIAASTDAILDFNDRYDPALIDTDRLQALEEDLSRLGEVLAERIQMEDRIIQALGGRVR
ncbi:MAG: Rsd/AlgQ family anti-sigma factor [Gammaproteobacteria bacterium]|nr:MAG: Rsd/AlgQ family anti-sigma factor [Gammaproteobacteria bacterium]